MFSRTVVVSLVDVLLAWRKSLQRSAFPISTEAKTSRICKSLDPISLEVPEDKNVPKVPWRYISSFKGEQEKPSQSVCSENIPQ